MSSQVEKSRRELRANLIASTLTGFVTMSITNPLDTLKSRWQIMGGEGRPLTLLGLARNISSQEGIWTGLWRPGLGPNVIAMGCAVGCRTGFYPFLRDSVGSMQAAVVGAPPGTAEKTGAGGMFLAGLLSGMLGYFVASPFLLVKTQMQAEAGRLGTGGLYETGMRSGSPPSYNSGAHALRVIAANGAADGRGAFGAIRALWRGAGVIVGRGAMLSASQLMTYDKTKTELKKSGLLGDTPLLHVVASVVAAFTCTTASMPFDVVLTVYQSAYSLGGERKLRYGSHGPIACARTMLNESGPLVFMRGWVPAFLRLTPQLTFSFFLYERLRALVGIGYLD